MDPVCTEPGNGVLDRRVIPIQHVQTLDPQGLYKDANDSMGMAKILENLGSIFEDRSK